MKYEETKHKIRTVYDNFADDRKSLNLITNDAVSTCNDFRIKHQKVFESNWETLDVQHSIMEYAWFGVQWNHFFNKGKEVSYGEAPYLPSFYANASTESCRIYSKEFSINIGTCTASEFLNIKKFFICTILLKSLYKSELRVGGNFVHPYTAPTNDYTFFFHPNLGTYTSISRNSDGTVTVYGYVKAKHMTNNVIEVGYFDYPYPPAYYEKYYAPPQIVIEAKLIGGFLKY